MFETEPVGPYLVQKLKLGGGGGGLGGGHSPLAPSVAMPLI